MKILYLKRAILLIALLPVAIVIGLGCDESLTDEPVLSATKYRVHVDYVKGQMLKYDPDSRALGEALTTFQNNILLPQYGETIFIQHDTRNGSSSIFYVNEGGTYYDDYYPSGEPYENVAELLELVKYEDYCSDIYEPNIRIPTVSIFITRYYDHDDDPEFRSWEYPFVPDELITPGAEKIVFGLSLRSFDENSNDYPSAAIFSNTIAEFYKEMRKWSQGLDLVNHYPIFELSLSKIGLCVMGHELCHAFGLPDIINYLSPCHDEDALGNSCKCIMNYIPIYHFKTETNQAKARDLIVNVQSFSLCESCKADTNWVDKEVFRAANFNQCTP